MSYFFFIQVVEMVHFKRGPFPANHSQKDQKSLSAPSLDCLCKAGTNSWSCSINPNMTGNLSLVSLWTVSARHASLPGHLIFLFTGTFYKSCLSVKSCSLVLLGPYFRGRVSKVRVCHQQGYLINFVYYFQIAI